MKKYSEKILSEKETSEAMIGILNLLGELRTYHEETKHLTDEIKILYLVEELESEVLSGGFVQYIFKNNGDRIQETLNALSEMGAGNMAALLKEAVEVFGSEPVSDLQEERLNLLDTLFFEHHDELNKRQIDYMKRELLAFDTSSSRQSLYLPVYTR